MKKSKFEKLTNEIIENSKKSLDNINELIQNCDEKDGFTVGALTEAYSRTSEQISLITNIKESNLNHNKEFETVYDFKTGFDLEED